MKRLLAFLLLCTTAFAGQTSNPQDAVFDVTIRSLGRGGSAVAIGDYLAVTCAHVVTAGNRMTTGSITLTNSQTGQRTTGQAIASDPYNDVALIQTDAKLPWVPVADNLERGQTVTALGYGRGTTLRQGRGRVLDVFSADALSDLTVQPGDSGSGLFNEVGELVAVTKGVPVNRPQTSTSTPAGRVLALHRRYVQTCDNAGVSAEPVGCSDGSCGQSSAGGNVLRPLPRRQPLRNPAPTVEPPLATVPPTKLPDVLPPVQPQQPAGKACDCAEDKAAFMAAIQALGVKVDSLQQCKCETPPVVLPPIKPADPTKTAYAVYVTAVDDPRCKETDAKARAVKKSGYPITIVTLTREDAKINDVPQLFLSWETKPASGQSNVLTAFSFLTK